jgi:hypothetical protein
MSLSLFLSNSNISISPDLLILKVVAILSYITPQATKFGYKGRLSEYEIKEDYWKYWQYLLTSYHGSVKIS